ncbi:MAG TPA: hypothetical protein VJ731_14050 [Terriglobales bacterium]|nr:hypothetical protein [Terriglobales bacterium]
MAELPKKGDCDSLESGIVVIRVLVFILATALCANAQCYGACMTSDCHPSDTTAPDGCPHHHQSPPPASGTCQHQHATVTGPEIGSGQPNLHAAAGTPLMAVLTPQANLVDRNLFVAATRILDTSPPNGGMSSGSTILRI